MTYCMWNSTEAYLITQGSISTNHHLFKVSYKRRFIIKWQAQRTSKCLYFKRRRTFWLPVSSVCVCVSVHMYMYKLVSTQTVDRLLRRVCWNALLAAAISTPSPLTFLFLSLLLKCQAHPNRFCAFLGSLWKWIQPFSEARISLVTHRRGTEILCPLFIY